MPIENPQYIHNGFAALQYFSMYMIGKSYMEAHLEDVFTHIIKPFIVMENSEESELTLTLRLEALALSIKHLQAFEVNMNPFIPTVLASVPNILGQFLKVFPTISTNTTSNMYRLYIEMISQSSHLCSFLFQVNKELLANGASTILQPACDVFLLDLEPHYKYELLELLGHLLLLSVLPKKSSSDDPYDSDDSGDENDFESVFLLKYSNEAVDDEVEKDTYWKISNQQVPFSTLLNVLSESVNMFLNDIDKDIKMKSKEVSNVPMFFSTVCGATLFYYDQNQHEVIVEKSIPVLLDSFQSCMKIQLHDSVRSLSQIIQNSHDNCIRDHFKRIHTSLEELFVNLKDWVSATPTRKNKKIYYKTREQIVKCVSTLLLKDCGSTFEMREHFYEAINSLFSDPQMLSSYVRAIRKYVDSVPDVDKEVLISEELPRAMNKYHSELSKEKTSAQVKTLIVRSISELAQDTSTYFVPYAEKTLDLLTTLFQKDAYRLGVPILDALSVILPLFKSSSKLPKVLITVLRKAISIVKDEENIENFDEDSEEYDNSGYLIYVAENFLYFVLKDPDFNAIVVKNNNITQSIKHTASNVLKKDLLYDEEDALKDMAQKILGLVGQKKKKGQ